MHGDFVLRGLYVLLVENLNGFYQPRLRYSSALCAVISIMLGVIGPATSLIAGTEL